LSGTGSAGAPAGAGAAWDSGMLRPLLIGLTAAAVLGAVVAVSRRLRRREEPAYLVEPDRDRPGTRR
jgi:hypothetical protein